MNSRSSGEKLEAFFNGKGFYIVLFLCAAVIGASAWMLAAGDRAMQSEISVMNPEEEERVETIVIPPLEESVPVEVTVPAEELPAEAEETPQPVWNEDETAPAVYTWPLYGEIERAHSTQALGYDVTMRDWRTHAGIDIAAALGSTVCAAHEGMVSRVWQDDLYGTMVSVDHGDGVTTFYANLAEMPAVQVGDWVEAGSVIGAVGTTALCEVGQPAHLHFAVTVDGRNADPMEYLPA